MDTTTKKAVTILTQADIPCVLWGLPGVGKTAWVSELTHFLGMNENPPMLTADCEPSLIMGIMYPAEDNKSLVRLAPEWAIKSSKEPNHLWFFDEISNADGATQATLLTAIQDRIVAGVKLHPTTRFIFAANPPEISPNGNNMSPPLANRLCHIQWDLSEQMVLDHLKSKYIQGYNKKFNDDEWQVKL
jgi:MoxR-like ATPase